MRRQRLAMDLAHDLSMAPATTSKINMSPGAGQLAGQIAGSTMLCGYTTPQETARLEAGSWAKSTMFGGADEADDSHELYGPMIDVMMGLFGGLDYDEADW